jgi:NitT/TauT family transport system substrate-binding protein
MIRSPGRALRRCAILACAVLALAGSGVRDARAEATELRITRQPGLLYIPMLIAEQRQLIEKAAAERGLGEIKVNWLTLSSGGAANDALLSGNIDVVTSGVSNMLLVNDRTRGDIKGIVGLGGMPMLLLSRNPAVKTLADFSAADRIAVPTVKISSQAIVLQIALEKQFGKGQAGKFDNITIQLGHPEAMAALTSTTNEVNSHFSLPPFQHRALKNPNVHTVMNSYEMLGEPFCNGILYGRTAFHDANPKLIESIRAALDKADEIIKTEPQGAAADYLAATKDKALTTDEIVGMLGEPGVFFSTAPCSIMLVANHLFGQGVIKKQPKDWKDYFFASAHGLNGN